MKPLDPLAVPLRGTNLIEASAGTGKTHTITTLYLRLLLERGLSVGDILVVTYTNAATAELRARIRRRLHAALAALEAGGEPDDKTLDQFVRQRLAQGALEADRRVLLAALHGFDAAAIFTIHGFCQRALQEHAFESRVPFDMELVTNQALLLDEVVQDFWVRELYQAPEIFVRHLQRKQLTPRRLVALAAKVVLHPGMPVLPEDVHAELGESLDSWCRAQVQAAAIWRKEREEILHLLCASAGLKRSTYKEESIRASWTTTMDAVLSQEWPGISEGFKAFQHFTSEGLEKGTKKGCTRPKHRFFEACDALLASDEALRQALDARLLEFQIDLVRYARAELRRRKEAANTQFFDDLLHGLNEALAGQGGATLAEKIRTQFHAALIDEFQDTDPVQYDIFRRVYHGSDAALFLIGDPKQAIYAFRGADVFTYMAAKRDAGADAHTLTTNWRSDPTLIRAVNGLFDQARDQFVFRQIPFLSATPKDGAVDCLGGAAAGQAPLQILFVRRQDERKPINKEWANEHLPDLVAAEIARFLKSGATIEERDVAPGDIAVLCRTNEQAGSTQVALRRLRIPSVLQTEASVFDSVEAVEVERVLRAAADPGDAGAVRAALATTLMGLSGHDVFALQEDERGWDAWMRRFQGWHEAWLHDGFVAGFHRLLDECEVQPRLLALTDGERRLTNILHLGELLHAVEVEERHGPLALVHWLSAMRADVDARAELAGEAAQIRLESDEAAVKLVTVHKAKGLEYPIVFCPYLWDGALLRKSDVETLRFHDPEDGDRLKLDLGSSNKEAHKALAEREALAENVRVLYVALTRAQHRCSLVWGAFREVETSALGYLLHQPRRLPEDDVDVAKVTAARIAALVSAGDDGLLADLGALAAAAGGAIQIAELPSERGTEYALLAEEWGELRCRMPQRALSPQWRVSSFSNLTAGERAVSPPAEEGQDRDEADAAAAEQRESAKPAVPVVLHDFPAGARPGQLIHEIFQSIDFQQSDVTALRAQVAERLARYGFEPKWTEPLCEAITDILETPLDDGSQPLTLRRIPLVKRLSELEFIFPVADEKSSADEGAQPAAPGLLTRARLAEVFTRCAAPPVPREYADRIRDLGFSPLAGYLKGFVDLVFEHAGRWYVVDYKSNYLGPSPKAYEPQRLGRVMADHHYFLQYHLYVVALHRYLTVRLADYDYDRHFGGVFYLFLRGMSPALPRGCGIFRDRPSRTLIESLSAVCAFPREGSRQRPEDREAVP
ncbi:MAG: exodeoxyribonuclease V subunit beta [Candidatus Binatia bacterium]